MKVYVITQGEYSDYHICGVALDAERAEAIREHFSKNHDTTNIEMYDTEDYDGEKLGQRYRIEIDKEGIATILVVEYASIDGSEENLFGISMRGNFVANIYAKDQDHALKIAFDKRAKMLAEKMEL